MTTTTYRIATPCHESWDAMPRVGQGRYCDVCTKTVVDLSDCTQTQAEAILAARTGPVCARMRVDRTGRSVFLAAAAASSLAACVPAAVASGLGDTGVTTTETDTGDTGAIERVDAIPEASARAPRGLRAGLRDTVRRVASRWIGAAWDAAATTIADVPTPDTIPEVAPFPLGQIALPPEDVMMGDIAIAPPPKEVSPPEPIVMGKIAVHPRVEMGEVAAVEE